MEWLDNLIAAIMAFFAQIMAFFSGLFGGSTAPAAEGLEEQKETQASEPEEKTE
jgi:hypothetical protein